MDYYVRKMALEMVLAFSLLSLSFLVCSVSAQTGIGISNTTFDRISYDLGSPGTVIISVVSYGAPSNISYCVVEFYSFKTDGSIVFWTTGSGESPPGNVPVGTTMLSYTFTTPTDTGIVSGPIYYTVTVNGTQSGYHLQFTTLLLRATDSKDNICVLSNPINPSYLGVVSDYISLYANYISLQDSYNSLQSNHNSLVAEFNAVKSQVNSMQFIIYGLAALTIILLARTIYSARRPKVRL